MADNRDLEIFCENFRWMRQHHGLTQKQMAQCLEISVGYVRRLERGELPPRLGVEIFLRIYRKFGISPSRQFSQQLSRDTP